MSHKKTASDARKLRLAKALKANIGRRKDAGVKPEKAPAPAKSKEPKTAE